MKNKIKGILRIAVIFTVVLCVSLAFAKQNYADSIEDEKKKQEEMQNELKNTKEYLSELEKLKGDTQVYIKELDVRLNQLTDNIYKLEQDIDVINADIEVIKLEIVDAKADIDSQYAAMKLRIKYMYENGESSYLSMILGSQNMSELLTRAEYLSQITTYDRQQLDKLRKSKEELDAKEAALLAKESELQDMLSETEAEHKATEDLIVAKKNVIDGYDSQINGAQSELDSLEEEIKAQKAIIAELEEIERRRKEEALKNQNNIIYNGGSMSWPVPGHSMISSYFGYRSNPFGGPGQEFHNGIDIPAPRGSTIICAQDGQVAWSYYSGSAGNWIGIDHGDGIYTIYMHMSQRIANEGDMVKRGDVIGLVGSTGRSTGNHLHFSVRKDGNYVNPLNWVAP